MLEITITLGSMDGQVQSSHDLAFSSAPLVPIRLFRLCP